MVLIIPISFLIRKMLWLLLKKKHWYISCQNAWYKSKYQLINCLSNGSFIQYCRAKTLFWTPLMMRPMLVCQNVCRPMRVSCVLLVGPNGFPGKHRSQIWSIKSQDSVANTQCKRHATCAVPVRNVDLLNFCSLYVPIRCPIHGIPL